MGSLSAVQVQAEKPNTILGVICGALHIADNKIQTAFQDFQTSLNRGQILPANLLKNNVDVEFIYDNYKYSLEVRFKSAFY